MVCSPQTGDTAGDLYRFHVKAPVLNSGTHNSRTGSITTQYVRKCTAVIGYAFVHTPLVVKLVAVLFSRPSPSLLPIDILITALLSCPTNIHLQQPVGSLHANSVPITTHPTSGTDGVQQTRIRSWCMARESGGGVSSRLQFVPTWCCWCWCGSLYYFRTSGVKL